MCRFCGEFNTGDCNESLLRIALCVNNKPFVGCDVSIDDDELELYVDSDPSGTEIARSRIKIQFCPICGQKLGYE